MPRVVDDVKLTTREARSRLAARHKPYFRMIEGRTHLGYRRSTVKGRAGTWLVRRGLEGTRYETRLLGDADDLPGHPADGERVLTFEQAQARARDWARERAAAERTSFPDDHAEMTVADAVMSYITERKARSPASGLDAERRLTRHVLGKPLASVRVTELRDRDLRAWRETLKPGGRGADKRTAPLAPASVARLLNDLRAALSASARRARASGEVLAVLRDGLRPPPSPDRARGAVQVLSDDGVRCVVAAADAIDPDFGTLVLVLAATGARLGQVARLTVEDLQIERGRLMVPTSHKGRGTKQQLFTARPLPPDVLARLRDVALARPAREPLLLRWHHQQVEASVRTGRPEWVRVERRPWTSSAEMTRPWRTALEAAGLQREVAPYALRSSSIVRQLKAGLPVRLVAAAHDTSVAMIEKHYSAFIVDAAEDMLRKATVELTSGASGP